MHATTSSPLAVGFGAAPASVCSVTPAGRVTILGAGVCTVTATQAGDADWLPASPVQQTFGVARATTKTTVASGSNPSTVGAPVTFTASVTSAAGIPSGTVTFREGSTPLCTARPTLDDSGAATCTTSGLTVGSHTISVIYAGDANFASAGSLSQSVTRATSATALTSSSNPSTYGAAVTLTASVTGPGPTATGTVTFSEGTTPLCEQAPLTSGVASCLTAALLVGSHTLSAVYGGDANFGPSTAALTQAATGRPRGPPSP